MANALAVPSSHVSKSLVQTSREGLACSFVAQRPGFDLQNHVKWWLMPIILALKGQEDQKLKIIVTYMKSQRLALST